MEDDSDFTLYVQIPRMKKLRRAKVGWDIMLIISSAVVVYLCDENIKDLKSALGEVILAAGSLPILLSLPLIFADWQVSIREQRLQGFLSIFQVRNHKVFMAYLFSLVMAVGGIWCGLRGGWIKTACLEMFAEVTCIYSITTLFGIPTVQDDSNSAQRFLSDKEKIQLQRAGVVSAPHARVTAFVLGREYHEDMLWKYPCDVPANLEELEDELLDESDRSAPRGALNSRLMGDVAPGWRCMWYVTALGYCDVNYLSSHLLEGLLTFLSGSAQCNRFLTQAAIDTLGNLYFQSKNKKISKRLLDVWMHHEIADVRAHCSAAIFAVAEPFDTKFLKQMSDLGNLADTTISKQYFSQQSVDTKVLDCDSLQELGDHLSGNVNERLMALIAACCLVGSQDGIPLEDPHAFLTNLDETIFQDPLESHLAKQLGLELVARLAEKVCLRPFEDEKQKILEIGITQLRTSVFKQVRLQGKKVLSMAGYPHAGLFDLYGGKATAHIKDYGFTQINDFLLECATPALVEDLQARLQVMEKPVEDLVVLFEGANTAKRVSTEPADDPVLLLYVYLATSQESFVPTDFIMERLNSLDYFERYVGLLCIGKSPSRKIQHNLRKLVCPGFVHTELISDVRDLALVVLEGTQAGARHCACIEKEEEEAGIDKRRSALSAKEVSLLSSRAEKYNPLG